jgi:ABC-2 type transport system ATP-binding protein
MVTIRTKDLNFKYNNTIILEGINIEIQKGSIYGYLGRNGSGKTTTMKLLAGLLQIQSGEIALLGKPVIKNLSQIKRNIGCLIGAPSLYEHFTAFEQLEYMDYYYKMGNNRINDILNIVGLTEEKKRKIKYFSTGMKQRLAIGVALYHNPDILILDEPLNGLDPNGVYSFRQMLFNLNHEGITILISSHILSELEKICTHIGILENGKLLFQGTMLNLMESVERKISFWTTNNDKSCTLLMKVHIPISEFSDTKFTIKLDKNQSLNDVLKILINNEIEILNMEINTLSLEEVFLNLIES